ncbi:uncharacterized protein LOC111378300 [Olea europaea var. sylvestris]|uniref:uncharacterized protein LOC111378300 n=1 Tax=Olea europaea var. sylvestris TaxID=158386 RepID=UPI000C1D8264|nr:uncharacterized protein LOC111378300 [Olea europaea var. sylvestris]
MRELMAQMQGQGGFPIPPYAPHGHYQQEDEVQSHRAASPDHGRGESPFEREVGVDISSNYASGRPSEVQMSHDNFPPPYEQDPRQGRAGSVFDRISPTEARPSQQQAQQPRTRPQPPPLMPQQPERRQENAPRAVPPRSRPQRREEEARNQPGPSHQQPRYEVEEYDSDEQQRLPSGSIQSWPEFKTTFLKRFAVSREGEAPIQRLQDMRQAHGESLKNFISRFTDEMTYCVQVTDREMNRSGNQNSGQALATTTLNAVPTLAYEDVNPIADPHQIQAQQGPCPMSTTPRIAEIMRTAPGRSPPGKDITRPQANRPPSRQDNQHGREAAAPRQRDVSPRR